MTGRSGHEDDRDSLDRIERGLLRSEALIRTILADGRLSLGQRETLISEIDARIDRGDFDDDLDGGDDDAVGMYVRRKGPQGPRGASGIALSPETSPDADSADPQSELRSTWLEKHPDYPPEGSSPAAGF